MSDIVERLRARDAYLSLDEADDEIERLRGLLRDINACQRHFDVGAWQVRLYQDHYDRINAAIAGAAVQPNGATWQPIETAPKQRKIIVHYLNEAEKHRTVMACYYGEKSLEMHDDYDDVGTWDEESGTLFADAGWYEEHDSDNPILPLGGVPTHWMPLPEPPATPDPTEAAPRCERCGDTGWIQGDPIVGISDEPCGCDEKWDDDATTDQQSVGG